MRKPQLVIMVKEPQPGRVKTRLGRDIGMIASAWWFRHQCSSLIRTLSSDARWRTILAISPDTAAMTSCNWPGHLPRLPQGKGDLGTRMGRVFRTLPPGPVVIIGADVPGITPAHINRAFRALGDHDAVFGPAPDGGYWLVGLKRTATPPLGLFHNVRWSTRFALSDTLASLPGKRIALIDELRDIDTGADLA